MSNCIVSIRFRKKTFVPGEDIQGEIKLNALEAFTCDALTAFLEWSVDGKGLPIKTAVATLPIFSGQCRAGINTYPFSFKAPDGPFSYEGMHFSVEWKVQVRVIAGAPVERVFELSSLFLLMPVEHMSRTAPYFFGLIDKPRQSKEPATSLFSFLAESKISRPEVSLSKSVVCRGDTLDVRLRFTAKKSITFDEVFAELSCLESVMDRIAFCEERTYQGRVAFVPEQDLSLDVYRNSAERPRRKESAKSGEVVTLIATLAIPEEAPASFFADSYNIETTVNVHLGIKGWPDWSASLPMLVHPGGPFARSARVEPLELKAPAVIIELERHRYLVGEEMRGVLVLQVPGGLFCKQINLSIQHQPLRSSQITTTQVFSVDVEDDKIRYPFACTAPSGPPSYHGATAENLWFLIAAVEIEGRASAQSQRCSFILGD